MQIRRVDYPFILVHLEELAHLHTVCFCESDVWHEHWTDYPTPGHDDSMSYLIDEAARDTWWIVAVDDDGEQLGKPGRILACAILERLHQDHAEELGIEIAGKEGAVFYNCVYFHHLEVEGRGLAHAMIQRRIDLAREMGGRELWTRTRQDHVHMHRILTEFGFEPMSEQEVDEAGERSIRVRYRKRLEPRQATARRLTGSIRGLE